MDLGEIGCGSIEWIQLAQDRSRWRSLVIWWWTCGFWCHGVKLVS
jgi:hypothetical protein